MDPEPGAGALAIRARGHSGRDLEVGVAVPRTGLVDRKDSKILGLDLGHVRLVCNSQAAAAGVVDVVGMELGRGLARAYRGVIGTALVAAEQQLLARMQSRDAKGCAPGSGLVPGGDTLIARDFGVCGPTDGKLEDVIWMGRIGEVTVLQRAGKLI